MHTARIHEQAPYFLDVANNLLEDLIFSLEAPPVSRMYSTKEYKVSICASQLAVAMCIQHNDLLTKILILQKVIIFGLITGNAICGKLYYEHE